MANRLIGSPVKEKEGTDTEIEKERKAKRERQIGEREWVLVLSQILWCTHPWMRPSEPMLSEDHGIWFVLTITMSMSGKKPTTKNKHVMR